MWRGQSSILTPGQVARRAGGRRKFNSIRRCRAILRRKQVAQLLMEGCPVPTIATRLNIHIATAYRDISALRTHAGLHGAQCPTCLRAWRQRPVPPGLLP